jgi:hypothetical protein
MDNEFKTHNKGGSRPGAGRKTGWRKIDPVTGQSNEKEYKSKINVLKELEKLYKQLDKEDVTKEKLEFVKTKIDLLNKLLPYVEMKKPTASLIQTDNTVPEMTVLSVIGEENTEQPKESEEIKKDPNSFV